MKILRALTVGFATFALSAGLASAAPATWTIGTVTGVLVRSTWTVSGTTSTEGSPVLVITMSSGVVFARLFPSPASEKSRQMIETARQAVASGRKLGIFGDPDRAITPQVCADFNASGCILTAAMGTFTIIEDMAIYP
jgi:hypothetical protein